MKKQFIFLLLIFTSLIFLNCGTSTVLMKKTVETSNKNWKVEILKIKAGPDSYRVGDMIVYSKNKKIIGFLWARIKVTNISKTTRPFSFMSWMAISKDYRSIATHVYTTNFFARNAFEFNIRPNDSYERVVGFMYKKSGSYPHSLIWKNIVTGETIKVPLPDL